MHQKISQEKLKIDLQSGWLIKTITLSSLICQLCEKHLKNAKKFRENLLANEKKLLKSLEENSDLNDSFCSLLTIERVINTDDLIAEEGFDLIEDNVTMILESLESENCEMLEKDEIREEKLESEKILEESYQKLNDDEKIQKSVKKRQNSTSITIKDFIQKSDENLDKNQIDVKKRKNSDKNLKISYATQNSVENQQNAQSFTTIDGKVICPHCQKPVIRAYIKHHIARLHLAIKNFTCDLCGRQFYKKNVLTAHMNTHLDKLPFVCSACPKTFASLTALGTHTRFHHTAFHSYMCETCGKGYKQKRLLEEHVRSRHTGDRAFKCTFTGCDAGFFSSGALRKHSAKSHTSQQPESCEICGKIFKSISALAAHKRLSHSKVTLECDFVGCGKTFPNRCYLENHRKRHGKIGSGMMAKVEVIEYLDYEILEDEEFLVE